MVGITVTQQQGAKIQRCIVVLGAICEHITVCKDIIKQLEYQSNDYWYVFIYYQFIYFQKKFESFEKLTFKKKILSSGRLLVVVTRKMS